MKKLLLLLLLFSTIAGKVFSQVVGDYRSSASGVWSTPATWQLWNGTAWVAAGAAPSSTNNVRIQSGHIITVSASGAPCADLVVYAGGKLYCNGFGNLYVNVNGDTLMCNGTIGNGATFDGISFNIEGANCRLLGSGGSFDASRIRKSAGTIPTTNLSIERDVKLRFCGGRQTQIYNNANSAAGTTGTRFNVTVAAGATLTLDSTVSAECVASGSALTLAYTCATTLNNPVVNLTNTTGIAAGMVVSGPGIIPGTTVVSFVINTSVTLSQGALSTNPAVILSFGGNTITNSTAINSYYGATFAVPGSLLNCRVYGTGIAPGAYIVSSTLVSGSQYNLQLSLPNTGPVSGTIYFVSDGNAAIDGITGLAAGPSAGSYTINGTMLVSGTIYLNNNCTSTSVDSTVTWTINNGGILKAGNVITAASGASKHTFRLMPGGKFEVFGLPGFTSVLNQTNNIYDFQYGSFTEFSGKGNQSVPFIPTVIPSSGFYGNLKISGYGIKSEISSTTFQIANDFEITNATGAPIFNASIASQFMVGGNWLNYHDSAFIENVNLPTVTFNRTGVSTIFCPSGEVFPVLKYQKTDSSEVRFLSNVTVRTQLSIASSGRVNLNGNTLNVLSPLNNGINIISATTARYIYGETGNFNSKVRWNIGTTNAYTRFAIPFAKGSGTANATPFAFAVDSGVQVDTMTVSTYGTPANNLPWPTAAPYNVTNLNSYNNLLTPDNSAATVDRFWYVGFSSPSVINDTIALSYASNEIPLSPYNDPTLLKAQYWNPNAGASGSWRLPSLGYYGTLFNVSGVVVPSPVLNNVWALASNSSPLPIELVDFRGKYINNQSVLSWVTASEKDNDYFILERSEDAREFTQIGKIDGAGNSNSFLNYQFIDIKPINKVAYYRLKQVDFDGQYSYSQVIALRSNQKLNTEIKAYPNPSNGNFLITNIPFEDGDNFVSQVFNIQGELLKKDLHISESSGNLLLQLNELKSGVYLVSLTNGYTTVSTRVILNK